MPLPNDTKYSGKPGVKPEKSKKKKGYDPKAPQITEEEVDEIMQTVYDVYERMAEEGKTNRVVFVEGIQDWSKDSISGMSKVTFMFPPDFLENSDGECIACFDQPIDYNYNRYDTVEPKMVSLLWTESTMRWYWGYVYVDSGDANVKYQGKVCKDFHEAMFEIGPGLWKNDRFKPTPIDCSKQRRTPGVPEIEEKDIRTDEYMPEIDRA